MGYPAPIGFNWHFAPFVKTVPTPFGAVALDSATSVRFAAFSVEKIVFAIFNMSRTQGTIAYTITGIITVTRLASTLAAGHVGVAICTGHAVIVLFAIHSWGKQIKFAARITICMVATVTGAASTSLVFAATPPFTAVKLRAALEPHELLPVAARLSIETFPISPVDTLRIASGAARRCHNAAGCKNWPPIVAHSGTACTERALL